jgi:hypothetical protein
MCTLDTKKAANRCFSFFVLLHYASSLIKGKMTMLELTICNKEQKDNEILDSYFFLEVSKN